MATINLSISAETPEDLHKAISGLAELFGLEAIEAMTVTDEEPTAAPEPEPRPTGAAADPIAAPKRGRGRPKKPVEQLAPPTPEETATAAPVAQANPLPPTAPPVSDAPAPKVTVDDVRAALKVLVDAKGRDAAMKVLRDQGFEKLSDVGEQMYGELIAKSKALLA